MKKNRYQEAHPEWFDDKGRPHPWVVRSLIDYNEDTGSIRWKERGIEWFVEGRRPASHQMALWNSVNSGKEIRDKEAGVLLCRIRCNQIASCFINGYYYSGGIAYKDGDYFNWSKANLLFGLASREKQIKMGVSSLISCGIKSKFLGVSFNNGRWSAHINKGGKRIYLGTFATQEMAARAYDKKALKIHGRGCFQNNPGRAKPLPDCAPEIVETDDF